MSFGRVSPLSRKAKGSLGHPEWFSMGFKVVSITVIQNQLQRLNPFYFSAIESWMWWVRLGEPSWKRGFRFKVPKREQNTIGTKHSLSNSTSIYGLFILVLLSVYPRAKRIPKSKLISYNFPQNLRSIFLDSTTSYTQPTKYPSWQSKPHNHPSRLYSWPQNLLPNSTYWRNFP